MYTGLFLDESIFPVFATAVSYDSLIFHPDPLLVNLFHGSSTALLILFDTKNVFFYV